MKKLWIAALLLVGVCVGFTGCEMPWDDDDGEMGTSTVQGNVSSFSSGGIKLSFYPAAKVPLLERAWSVASDLLVAPAQAAGLGGLIVELRGAGRSVTTADDGSFVISGVPKGTFTLVVRSGDREVTYPLAVEDDVTITLNGIRVSEDAAGTPVLNISRVQVTDTETKRVLVSTSVSNSSPLPAIPPLETRRETTSGSTGTSSSSTAGSSTSSGSGSSSSGGSSAGGTSSGGSSSSGGIQESDSGVTPPSGGTSSGTGSGTGSSGGGEFVEVSS